MHGPGIDRPLEAFRADGYLEHSRMFLHADWRGSITLGSWEDGTKDRFAPSPMIDWEHG